MANSSSSSNQSRVAPPLPPVVADLRPWGYVKYASGVVADMLGKPS